MTKFRVLLLFAIAAAAFVLYNANKLHAKVLTTKRHWYNTKKNCSQESGVPKTDIYRHP